MHNYFLSCVDEALAWLDIGVTKVIFDDSGAEVLGPRTEVSVIAWVKLKLAVQLLKWAIVVKNLEWR